MDRGGHPLGISIRACSRRCRCRGRRCPRHAAPVKRAPPKTYANWEASSPLKVIRAPRRCCEEPPSLLGICKSDGMGKLCTFFTNAWSSVKKRAVVSFFVVCAALMALYATFATGKVRKTLSWPRSWANFSPL